jgi:hypothetical protein
MKVLSIGNSFSQDAHKWLNQVSRDGGEEIYCVNLYIGGCPLKTHWENYLSDEPLYDLEINGEKTGTINISDALKMDRWDVITLQQASGSSGKPQSYLPYLPKLAENVRRICPGAKLWIQQTWAYEHVQIKETLIERFERVYSSSQREMYTRLCDAYEMASKLISAPLIPVGKVIQRLRDSVPEFDFQATGRSLNRDGYHLDLIYGRFAAALTWYGTLTGRDVRQVGFVPFVDERQGERKLLDIIKNTVYDVLEEEKAAQAAK